MKPKIFRAYNPTRVIIIGKKNTIIAQKDDDNAPISVSLTKTSRRAISPILITETYPDIPFNVAIRNFIAKYRIQSL